MNDYRIDFEAIAITPKGQQRTAKIMNEIERVGHVVLSDCFVNDTQCGLQVLDVLERMFIVNEQAVGTHRNYRLKVLRDKWGDPVRPGDKVRWKAQVHSRQLRGAGDPLTSTIAEDMKRRGEGSKLVEMGEAVVDEYGTITLGYKAAAQLISNHGQHYANVNDEGQKLGICMQKECSSKPVRIESSGRKRYRWNWLYEEVVPGTELELWKEPEQKIDIDGESIEELQLKIAHLEKKQEEEKKMAELRLKAQRIKSEIETGREQPAQGKAKKHGNQGR
jgi:hypothetical protein